MRLFARLESTENTSSVAVSNCQFVCCRDTRFIIEPLPSRRLSRSLNNLGCLSSTQIHSKARAIRRFLQYSMASVHCRRLQCKSYRLGIQTHYTQRTQTILDDRKKQLETPAYERTNILVIWQEWTTWSSGRLCYKCYSPRVRCSKIVFWPILRSWSHQQHMCWTKRNSHA
jgi:hypothetical protein